MKIKNILILSAFILGVLILVYPVISKIMATNNQSTAIANYKNEVANLTNEEKEKITTQYNVYNKDLYNNPKINLSKTENKTSSIDFLKSGEILGYIEIEKINLKLPIYEGTSTKTLSNGIGHMQNTSIPCRWY